MQRDGEPMPKRCRGIAKKPHHNAARPPDVLHRAGLRELSVRKANDSPHELVPHELPAAIHTTSNQVTPNRIEELKPIQYKPN